ncbi:MAG: thioesterase [Desulfobacterales bacterium GWB2_56_26]|nr:MAG: thioesterase [Desulfobacterales bacterium GWB2_56_26]
MQEHIFCTTTRVLYGDTDAGGVVYNANYLRYFEIGRTELMRAWVLSYRDIESLGLVLPVTECWSRYKAPAFYDDLLTIETTIAEISNLKCRFNYRILRAQEHLDRPKLLVKGYTVHAAVTRDGKLARLPEEILLKMTPLTQVIEKTEALAK